jgi:hypothetical protein
MKASPFQVAMTYMTSIPPYTMAGIDLTTHTADTILQNHAAMSFLYKFMNGHTYVCVYIYRL